VTFTDKSVGSISGWLWNFGDGKTSTKQNPVHIYKKPGVFMVTLIVSGYEGSNATTSTINVYPIPKANFSVKPKRGVAHSPINFTDKSEGSVVSWSWDFGDGRFSKEQHPVHTYTTAGNFLARLTVTGPDSVASSTKSQKVSIRAPK
jgi:PKD repeat protein